MSFLFDAATCGLLAELIHGPVFWCNEEGTVLHKADFAGDAAVIPESRLLPWFEETNEITFNSKFS